MTDEPASPIAGLRFGVAAARWNQTVTDKLLDGALNRLSQLDVADVEVMRVPGSLELPLGALELARAGCDAVVAIGVVVKGETDHYEIVVRESARGLSLVALETGVPITNAILAVHEFSQALDRAGSGPSNKGTEAVDAALAMVRSLREIRRD